LLRSADLVGGAKCREVAGTGVRAATWVGGLICVGGRVYVGVVVICHGCLGASGTATRGVQTGIPVRPGGRAARVRAASAHSRRAYDLIHSLSCTRSLAVIGGSSR
jgi:hypothetical protein